MSTIAVVGNAARDVVAGSAPRAGGPVFYATRALARLGADGRVAARAAAADRGLVLDPIAAFGLPLAWSAGSATASFSFHYEGDHRVMTVEAVGDPWTPADVEGWAALTLEGAGWVHVGALLRTDFDVAALGALARDGRRLLVDAQGLVRVARVGPLQRDARIDPELLRHVRMLKLNGSEAAILAGGLEPEQLRDLRIPELILTLGPRGAMIVTPGAVERVPAAPVAEVTDPTGAGDTFSAAYLHARSCGAEPVEAARAASAFVGEVIGAG
jgi:sugar/nucleoside kinase (ribokinase family)